MKIAVHFGVGVALDVLVSTAVRYEVGPMWILLAPSATIVAAEAHSNGA
jgi:hypothetical protein